MRERERERKRMDLLMKLEDVMSTVSRSSTPDFIKKFNVRVDVMKITFMYILTVGTCDENLNNKMVELFDEILFSYKEK